LEKIYKTIRRHTRKEEYMLKAEEGDGIEKRDKEKS
jgi:hypothetical protein